MYRVLLADDEQIERMALARRLMRRFGDSLQISEATDGKEAVELYQKEHSQIIIMDISMPELNGVEAAEQIRSMDEDCVIVFLTAYDEFSYAKRAIVIRALDYLLKPFEDGELESAILRAKERIETDRGKQRDTGLSRSVPDKAPVKEQYPGALEGDGPEINAAVIRLCLPFDENTAGLTGYVRDAVLYMASHYGESTINVAKIAGAVGISEGHLSHCFKKETGYTVMGWLTRYRMKKAVELLSDHRNKVYEVAEKVGYKDIAYFSNTFKKIAGVAPSEIQEK